MAITGALTVAAGLMIWQVGQQVNSATDRGIRVAVAIPPREPVLVVADPALIERSALGPLPIIAHDGRQAWQVYARPFNLADRRPRLAVVITGLGLDADLTRAAIERLPGAVTLGFSPYAHELGDWVGAARRAGHEVVLELPMEPADFPRGEDPGPETLLTSLAPEKNLERLQWILSRATGYVGLVGVMGERFAATSVNLAPILDAIKARGLLFIDDRAAAGTVAVTLARQNGMAWAMADQPLEGDATAIDQALANLESVARRRGVALGLGSLHPVTLDRLGAWIAGLDAKGLALAPCSAIVKRQAAP